MYYFPKLMLATLGLAANLAFPIFASNLSKNNQSDPKSLDANGDSICAEVSLGDAMDFIIYLSQKIATESTYIKMLQIECENADNPLMLARVNKKRDPDIIKECPYFLEAPGMPDFAMMPHLRLPLESPGEGTDDGGSSGALLDPITRRFWIWHQQGLSGRTNYALTGVLSETFAGDLAVVSENLEIFKEASLSVARAEGGVRSGEPWFLTYPDEPEQCKSDILTPLKKDI